MDRVKDKSVCYHLGGCESAEGRAVATPQSPELPLPNGGLQSVWRAGDASVGRPTETKTGEEMESQPESKQKLGPLRSVLEGLSKRAYSVSISSLRFL